MWAVLYIQWTCNCTGRGPTYPLSGHDIARTARHAAPTPCGRARKLLSCSMAFKGTEALEVWSKRMCAGYRGVHLSNMTSAFKDGLAFCAIIHRWGLYLWKCRLDWPVILEFCVVNLVWPSEGCLSFVQTSDTTPLSVMLKTEIPVL